MDFTAGAIHDCLGRCFHPEHVLPCVIQHARVAMGIRTVRLDDDSEAVLADLRQRTGMTISELLKRGLEAYASTATEKAAMTPYEIYRRLDPGPGGYAVAPASDAKAAIAGVIGEKRRR